MKLQNSRVNCVINLIVLAFIYDCRFFDAKLCELLCLQVETIADSYMVVSGLPRTNEDRHICEIANLALSLLHEIHKFQIRHRPNEIIKLRIGIHTGPCAAGNTVTVVLLFFSTKTAYNSDGQLYRVLHLQSRSSWQFEHH